LHQFSNHCINVTAPYRENGITALTYRTTFSNLADGGDLTIPESGETAVIWAMGKMAERAHRSIIRL
jgi:hypothetical protein